MNLAFAESFEASNMRTYLDRTVPEKNIWKLYKYIDGISKEVVNKEYHLQDSKVLNGGKTFVTGEILETGTYYTKLTVFDENGNSDTAQSETVQVTLPTQMLLVHASFSPVIARSVEDTTWQSPTLGNGAFEFDSNGEVKVQFKSFIQTRGRKQPKNLVYKWDFGDGYCTDTSQSLTADCTSFNPLHTYKRSDLNRDRIDYHPELTVTAIWPNGYSESWSSKAGTVSIIDKPEFVAIELLPNTTIGNVPLTVNFIVSDKSFVKNATILSYEFYSGDVIASAEGDTSLRGDASASTWQSPTVSGTIPSESQSTPDAALRALRGITFTHTYTTRGDFSPTLKVKIKENPTREISFNSPIISTNSLLVSTIEVLDPLDGYVTNQPIQTFKIATQYSNPFSNGNRLTIHAIDEEGSETVTELNPDSTSQTISLSEGINSYWFELIDSSGAVQKSLSRKVVLDTVGPNLEIISPDKNSLISSNEKLIISGTVEDALFDSISYKVNNETTEKKIAEDALEDLGSNKKAFNITLDPNVLGKTISKAEVTSKDKGGNVGGGIISINPNRSISLKNQIVESPIKMIFNNDSKETVKQGEPFALNAQIAICDDSTKPKDEKPPAKLVINSFMLFINENQFPTIIPEKYNLSLFSSDSPDVRTNIGNPNEDTLCPIRTFFESSALNSKDLSSTLLFDPGTINTNPSLTWPIGTYIIKPQITIDGAVQDKYGTTASTNNFVIDVIREVKADIGTFNPSNLILNRDNLITFKLNLYDSIPFSENNTPGIIQSFITKPSGVTDPVTIYCPNETVKSKNEMEKTCSFNYTPTEFTYNEDAYILTINVQFADSTAGTAETTAKFTLPVTKSVGVDFAIPAKIINPVENTVIESNNQQILSELELKSLPETLQNESIDKLRNLSKYAIQFLSPESSKEIKPITSISGDAIKVKQTIKDLSTKILQFKTALNFNLSTNTDFIEDFKSLNAFGPAKLYSIISNGDLTNETSDFSLPQKIVILDKPKIQSKKLKEKINKKTGEVSKVLNLTIVNNAGRGKAYPLELELEPRDINGSVLSYGRNIQKVYIPKNKLSTELAPINDLPKETNEVKITLNRENEFLNKIQERLDNENFGINIIGNNIYKHSDTQLAKLDIPGEKEVVTYCEVEPENVTLGNPFTISYGLKSEKAVSISATGTRISYNSQNDLLIPDIQEKLNSRLDSKHGNIDSSILTTWGDYSSVTFTLKSGDESDSCVLKIGSESAFNVGDLNNKEVTVDGKTISVQGLNQLLFTLGYLQNENENGYTTNTRDAFAKLICDYRAIQTNLSNIRFLTLYGSCQENDYSTFKANEEEVKIATKIQDFMRGILESNAELYHEIKKNPALATFVIGFAVAAGVIITAGSVGIDAYTASVLAQLGAVGVLTQVEDIKNKLAGYFNESDSFKAGYIFGEAGKFIGLAVVIGFASKGLTNLSYTIQGVKQAQILSEQGHKDLANAIYEQVSRINNAINDVKVGLQKGLDGVLKTVDDIQTGEIFKDFQRLWSEVTQAELQNIKSYALKLFNDIVAKLQQQEELFKIYETDPGGYETGIIRNTIYDQNLKEAVERLNLDLPKEIASAISAKVNGLVNDLTQKFVNDGFTLIGRSIPKDQVPQKLSTVMKVSDLKYLLKGTRFEKETNEDVILAAIESEEIVIEKLVGEISGKSKLRWWTDSAKLEELKQTGKYTKEFINGDEGLALDYDLTESKALIRIDIDTNNLPDKFFHIPISTDGGYKFVPSTSNVLNRSGKTKGGFLELTSPPVSADKTSGYVKSLDVIN